MKSYTMPAGEYFIGDPCYVFSHETWSDVCDLFSYDDRGTTPPVVTFNERPLWAAMTCYGDGCYPDDTGHVYGVDSGLIGVVPSSLWSTLHDPNGHVLGREHMKRLGRIVVFGNDFAVSVVSGHNSFVIKIGDVSIETDDTDGDTE